MKLIFTLFFTFSTFVLSASTVDSKVNSVRIFLNQAEVTRTASVRLSSGSQTVVLGDISTLIDPNSIQVKGKGEFIIMGTFYQRNYLVDDRPAAPVKQLKDSITLVDKKLSTVSNEIVALTQEEELLKANKVIRGENGTLTSQDLKSMVDFFGARILSIRNELYDLNVKEQELNELLNRLKRQLNERSSDLQKVNGEIVVEVKASKAVTGTLEVTYIVSGASWQPEYDLRSGGLEESLTLSYKAQIQQNTGENWENVSLTLSTANPSVGGSLPDFYPWYLDFFQPVMYKSQPSMAGVQRDMAVAEEAMVIEDAELMSNYVSAVENTLSIEYEIDLPYTLMSGTKPTTVSIRDQKMETEYIYQAIPRLSGEVFLVAKAKKWGALDLLPGTMNVYFEGGFVNKTFLDPETVEEELAISLGADNGIEVERKELKDLTKRQTIGANKKISYVYQLTVSNEKKKEVLMEVIDQIPVSKNSDIEVTVEELSGGKLDKDTGKITWGLLIPAQEKRSMRLAYEVKHPKDKQVPGL